MDLENISDLEDIAPKNCRAKILLLGDFDPENDRIIRDPYYVCNSMIDFLIEKYIFLLCFY